MGSEMCIRDSYNYDSKIKEKYTFLNWRPHALLVYIIIISYSPTQVDLVGVYQNMSIPISMKSTNLLCLVGCDSVISLGGQASHSCTWMTLSEIVSVTDIKIQLEGNNV